MKSTLFNIDPTNYRETEISNDLFEGIFTIPTLPAYAVEYFVVQVGALPSYQDKEDRICENQLFIKSSYSLVDFNIKIVIHYHGIKDHSLLFPWVSNEKLRERLGHFYNEAELNFESGAWLSFALMSGAIFEGMLYARLNNKKTNFNRLITQAYDFGIIDEDTKDIMNMVREQRNLVHANKYRNQYVTRSEAMNIRTILDNLIKNI